MMSGVHPVIVETPEPFGTASWHWSDENHTRAFAQALAKQSALAHAYIELQGDLGAGKTSFVRHLLQALGVQGRIKSPTYAVLEPHETLHPQSLQPLSIWHFDFYRFKDPQEFEEAGFRDVFASVGLKIAEWPEQAKGMLPVADLKLSITVDAKASRQVTCTAFTEAGARMLQGLENTARSDPSPLISP